MFNKIFLMIFYAHRQLKIPSLIAIASGCMTVILNIILIPHFQHVALALSLSICAWLQLFSYITISARNGWIHCCWHCITMDQTHRDLHLFKCHTAIVCTWH